MHRRKARNSKLDSAPTRRTPESGPTGWRAGLREFRLCSKISSLPTRAFLDQIRDLVLSLAPNHFTNRDEQKPAILDFIPRPHQATQPSLVVSTDVEQLKHKPPPRLSGAFDSSPKTSENGLISGFQTLPEKRSLSAFTLRLTFHYHPTIEGSAFDEKDDRLIVHNA